MGYANRRPRSANGNFNSRVLKPVKKKSYCFVWGGALLLLLVAGGAAALCLFPRSEIQMQRKAAEKVDAKAMPNSGWLHANGKGIDEETPKADKSSESEVQKYRKAAGKGDARAIHNSGRLYANGKGIDTEKSKAGESFVSQGRISRTAAEKGDAQAMFDHGMRYYLGDGVEKDLGVAVMWFKRAVEHAEQDRDCTEQNHHRVEEDPGLCALMMLGVCYDDAGRMDEAVKWYRKAAEKGVVPAMHILANCYSTGNGVEQDFYEAAKWWKKEAALGTPEEKEKAKSMLREVQSLLR